VSIEKKICSLHEPTNNFFVKSRLITNNLITNNKLSFYYNTNTEQKGQYTGWVERVVIPVSIQGNYRI
jgi:hypothetical protein